LAAVVALSASGCRPDSAPFPEGNYVMVIKPLELRDTIHLHADLSWERKVTYPDNEGATQQLFEKGTAEVVKSSREVRVLKFEPFTFVFENLLPIDMTSIRPPSKTFNTTMVWRCDGRGWVLYLNSEFGYEYRRISDSSAIEMKENTIQNVKGPESADERLKRIREAIEKENKKR
jgi:hypothetical protein